jgi:hypothetical protein
MKKVIFLTLLAIVGCTTAEMPTNKSNIKTHIFTKGKMNGYSVSENEIMEGRTKGANYKRLLISDGDKEVITRLAYDCDEHSKNKDICTLHIWSIFYTYELYCPLKEMYGNRGINKGKALISVFPSYWDWANLDENWFHCSNIYINSNAVTFLDKKEAEEYESTHPKLWHI